MSGPNLAPIENQSLEYGKAGKDSSISREYRLGGVHWLYKKYFEIVLVFCGWDLFAIYKNRRASHPSLPELQVSRISSNKWRRRVRVPLICLVCYLVVRLIIFGLVKITDAVLLDMYVFNSTRLQSLSDSSRARLNAFLSPGLSKYIMPSYYQDTIKLVMKLGDSAREPFDLISTTTDLMEVFIAVPMFFFYVVLPLTHQRTPLNATIQRFMLDPVREIARIDLSIRRHIESIIDEGSKSQLLRMHSDHIASLRPHTFNLKWYRFLYRLSITISLVVVSEVTVASSIFFYALYKVVERNVCVIHGFVDCGYRTLFTTSDSIYIGEIVIATAGTTLAFSLLVMVLVCTNSIAQLAMIRATHLDLNRCLSILKSSNRIARDMYSLDYYRNRSFGRLRSSIGSRLVDSKCLLKNSSEEQKVELCLLRTYLKLVVTLDEVKQVAHFVGRMVETNLSIIGYIVFTIFINFIYNDFKIPPTQAALFINCFVLTNPFMLICSYAFARTIELEKIAWSILAELAIYQDLTTRRGNPRSYKSSHHIEALAWRWRKLVQSHAISSLRNASHSFGLSMTYGQVINIDFFVISVGLVLMKR